MGRMAKFNVTARTKDAFNKRKENRQKAKTFVAKNNFDSHIKEHEIFYENAKKICTELIKDAEAQKNTLEVIKRNKIKPYFDKERSKINKEIERVKIQRKTTTGSGDRAKEFDDKIKKLEKDREELNTKERNLLIRHQLIEDIKNDLLERQKGLERYKIRIKEAKQENNKLKNQLKKQCAKLLKGNNDSAKILEQITTDLNEKINDCVAHMDNYQAILSTQEDKRVQKLKKMEIGIQLFDKCEELGDVYGKIDALQDRADKMANTISSKATTIKEKNKQAELLLDEMASNNKTIKFQQKEISGLNQVKKDFKKKSISDIVQSYNRWLFAKILAAVWIIGILIIAIIFTILQNLSDTISIPGTAWATLIQDPITAGITGAGLCIAYMIVSMIIILSIKALINKFPILSSAPGISQLKDLMMRNKMKVIAEAENEEKAAQELNNADIANAQYTPQTEVMNLGNNTDNDNKKQNPIENLQELKEGKENDKNKEI